MRAPFLLSALLVLSLGAVPASLAETKTGSVATGETDTYGEQDPDEFCAGVVTTWQVTLRLEDPSPVDVVNLTAHGMEGEAHDTATGLSPAASVSVRTETACLPLTEITGKLVLGSVDYTLTFEEV